MKSIKRAVSFKETTSEISSTQELKNGLLPDPHAPLPDLAYEHVSKMISKWVEATPQAVAIACSGVTKSYQDFEVASNLIVDQIKKLGNPQRHVIAVTGKSSFGLIASMFAVMKSDAILLSIDPKLPEKRKLTMLEEAQAGLVLAAGEDAISTTFKDQKNICFVEIGSSNGQILKSYNSWSAPQIHDGGDDAAYIFFTSGTTGKPKGILGSKNGLAHFLHWQRDFLKVAPGDRSSQLIGLSFDVMLRDIFLPLVSGATLCIPEGDLGGDKVLSWMEKESITITHAVPTLTESWLPFQPEGVTLKNLRYLIFGGEPLKDTLINRWRSSFSQSTKIVNFYGPSETTLAKLHYPVPDIPSKGIQPVGFTLPDSQAIVIDADFKQCGIGEVGEIVIRTPYMSHGYLSSQNVSNERFIMNPFTQDPNDWCYRTGDMGRYRFDGALELIGRIDHQVKIAGQRVELGEVEVAILRHSGIAQVTVIPFKTKNENYQLAAFVVTKIAGTLSGDQLREYLAPEIPGHMVPTKLIFLPVLPVTANGKVDRDQLFSLLAKNDTATDGSATLITETERRLSDIWNDILEVKPGRDDHFFKCGGDSLLLLKFGSMIRQVFKIDISANSIFEFPKLGDLAAVIDREKQKKIVEIANSKLQGQKPTSGPLAYSQELHYYLEDDLSKPRRRTTRVLELNGKVDIALLEKSFRHVVKQNPILRTAIRIIDGKATQFVQEAPDRVLKVEYSKLKSSEDIWEIFKPELDSMNQEFFNFESGDLFRASLLVAGEDKYLLAVRASHVICDLISMNLLLDQVVGNYRTLLLPDASVPQTEQNIDYLEFALWQKRIEAEPEFVEKENFWKSQLLTNHFEKENWFSQNPLALKGQSVILSNDKVESLNRFCKFEGVTPFNVLLANFGNHLLRQFNREKIMVELVHSGRFLTAFNNLVGNFAMAIPVCIESKDQKDFQHQVECVRTKVMRVNGKQYYPVHRLVKNHIRIIFQLFPQMQPVSDSGFSVPKNVSLDDLYGGLPVRDINIVMSVWEKPDGMKVALAATPDFMNDQQVMNFLKIFQEDLEKFTGGNR